MTPEETASLLAAARSCVLCAHDLPHRVRPVFQLHPSARLLVAGQAPGRRVHASGIPFDDPSGDRLRAWMGIDAATFYDPEQVAILPMGLCYPGTGSSGDLPPRPECAPTWRGLLLSTLPALQWTVAIGQYALTWHVPSGKRSVTEVVRDWRIHAKSRVTPLPHPSPRNNRWLKVNPWFEQQVVPDLRRRVHDALAR